MDAKELTDTPWAAFRQDSRWDGISDGERVSDATITVFPFDGPPITISIEERKS